MWVVEFKSKVRVGEWLRLHSTYSVTEEEAAACCVVRVFDEPDYEYRIREVKD